ncbi:hypothetical protein BJ742DRAFT_819778 [Cladochytrium replicatum]|nr:hypothetical protein BJ742DRAFT_819778 [Cladochytrium replicatum]
MLPNLTYTSVDSSDAPVVSFMTTPLSPRILSVPSAPTVTRADAVVISRPHRMLSASRHHPNHRPETPTPEPQHLNSPADDSRRISDPHLARYAPELTALLTLSPAADDRRAQLRRGSKSSIKTDTSHSSGSTSSYRNRNNTTTINSSEEMSTAQKRMSAPPNSLEFIEQTAHFYSPQRRPLRPETPSTSDTSSEGTWGRELRDRSVTSSNAGSDTSSNVSSTSSLDYSPRARHHSASSVQRPTHHIRNTFAAPLSAVPIELCANDPFTATASSPIPDIEIEDTTLPVKPKTGVEILVPDADDDCDSNVATIGATDLDEEDLHSTHTKRKNILFGGHVQPTSVPETIAPISIIQKSARKRDSGTMSTSSTASSQPTQRSFTKDKPVPPPIDTSNDVLSRPTTHAAREEVRREKGDLGNASPAHADDRLSWPVMRRYNDADDTDDVVLVGVKRAAEDDGDEDAKEALRRKRVSVTFKDVHEIIPRSPSTVSIVTTDTTGSEDSVPMIRVSRQPVQAVKAAVVAMKTAQQSAQKGLASKAEEEMLSKRKRIAREILESERRYCDDLALMKRVFVEPLKPPSRGNGRIIPEPNLFVAPMLTLTRSNSVSSSSTSRSSSTASNRPASTGSSMILTNEQFNAIFSNVEDIIRVNNFLLARLEDRLQGTFDVPVESDSGASRWTPENGRLGDVFSRLGHFLKVYRFYIKNYDSAIAVVRDQKDRNPFFAAFLREQSNAGITKGLAFESFLIMPVQRIPRYRLLLENIYRYTSPTHPDYQDLSVSLRLVETVARWMNESIREQELFMQTLHVQSALYPSENLLEAGRRLLRVGKINKICRKNIQIRWMYLFNDILVLTSPTPFPQLINHGKYDLEDIYVSDVSYIECMPTVFSIETPTRSFQAYTDTREEKEAWIEAITKAKETLAQNRKTLALGLPSRTPSTQLAPIWIPDAAAPHCMSCRREFTFLRRRHHCRHCGRVVCHDCSTGTFVKSTSERDIALRACDTCCDRIEREQVGVVVNNPRRYSVSGSLLSHSSEPTRNAEATGTRRRLPVPNKTSHRVSAPADLEDVLRLRPGEGWFERMLRWVWGETNTAPESTLEKCGLCSENFGLLVKKCECKRCGRAVCDGCSKHPGVCDACRHGVEPSRVVPACDGWSFVGELDECGTTSSDSESSCTGR